MNATFKLAAAPASGARIRRVLRHSGARLASDAQITLVILRQVTQFVGGGVFPDLTPRPVGQRTHFRECLTGRQAMQFGFSQIFSRDGLLSPQSCEPRFVGLKCPEQGIHFAQLAAFCRIFAVKHTERRFLLLNALPRNYTDQVQFPITCELVAKFVSLRKVVAGLEEKHRDAGQALSQQVENNDVFSLKATGKTGVFLWSLTEDGIDDLLGGSRFQGVPIVGCTHVNPPSVRLCRASREVLPRWRALDGKRARCPWMNRRPQDRSRIHAPTFGTGRDLRSEVVSLATTQPRGQGSTASRRKCSAPRLEPRGDRRGQPRIRVRSTPARVLQRVYAHQPGRKWLDDARGA